MPDNPEYARSTVWGAMVAFWTLLWSIWTLPWVIISANSAVALEGDAKERTTTTSFLSLPRELRDHIYSYAVIEADPIYLCIANNYRGDTGGSTHCDLYHPKNPSEKRHTAYNLLRTNHQIRAEVQELFFTRNTFEIYFTIFVPVRKHLMAGCVCPSMLRHIKALQITSCQTIGSKFLLRYDNGENVVEEGWTESELEAASKGDKLAGVGATTPVKSTPEVLTRVQQGFSEIDLSAGFSERVIRDLDQALFHGHQEEIGRDLASYDFIYGKQGNELAEYEEEFPPDTAEEHCCEECSM